MSLRTTGDATNSGVIEVSVGSGEGGSSLTVGGTLTNSRTIAIGNDTLSAASTVKAARLENSGTIDLTGSSTAEATLNVTGAFTNDGSVNLSQDADTLAGAVGGTGSFSLSNGSKLEFGSAVSSGETVTFGEDTSDTLILDQPSTFQGTIDDFFTKGELVDASTFAFSHTTFRYTQTGAESCSWTLTDDANTAVLNFAGEFYRKSDFSIVSANGGAGSAIKFVGPSDYWTGGTANWNTPGDWSAGVPTASSDVVINGGNPQVTASFGTVNSIADSGQLAFINAGASSVTGGVSIGSGAELSLDASSGAGGSSLTVGGTLTNSLSCYIFLDGSSTAEATLNVTGAFTNDGEVDLVNDADKLAGAIGGTGSFSLYQGSKLEFGSAVSSGETVTFWAGAPDKKLILDQPSTFQGTIDDFFTKGDTVDAKGFAYSATTFRYTQTGAESCSWTLTDGANTAVLNFAGEPYRKSDFSIVSANGGAGSAIKFVGPSDYWTDSSANWNTPGDWSAGVPTASSDVVIIGGGNPQVTASFGTVNSIADSGQLDFNNAGASSVTGGVSVNPPGALDLDASSGAGGSSLTVGGALTNSGTIAIGPSDNSLAAASTVTAASLDNTGTINLNGSSSAEATLNVTGAFTNDFNIFLSQDTEKIAAPISGGGSFLLKNGSMLEFGSAVSSGQGVGFEAGSADELILDQPLAFHGTIYVFGAGDEIDFPTLAYAKGDHAVDTNGSVAIETSAGKTVAKFNVIGTYASANFNVGKDVSGDVLVTYAATAANAAADLLGRYDSAFAEPPSTPTSDALAFDAWTALGSSAGTYSGFDFHHDGTAGGARDAWGIGVDWNGAVGHGPGPGS